MAVVLIGVVNAHDVLSEEIGRSAAAGTVTWYRRGGARTRLRRDRRGRGLTALAGPVEAAGTAAVNWGSTLGGDLLPVDDDGATPPWC